MLSEGKKVVDVESEIRVQRLVRVVVKISSC